MIFRRRSMYYIFQMYIPCVCIVALSWVSFWINHEAVPARVALSITTVLTISYMRGSVNAGMPRVSYLKSIDYFLLGGFVFIFMTLLEYVLVLKQSRKLHIFDHGKKNDYELTENGEDLVSKSMMITAHRPVINVANYLFYRIRRHLIAAVFHYVLLLFPRIIMFLPCNVVLITVVTKDQNKAVFAFCRDFAFMSLSYFSMNQACCVLALGS